jgi:transposase InsO family protein
MRAFEKLQVDTKHLDDIPSLLPAIQAKRLPAYEYTAKDVATGIAYVCLAYEASEINSLRFIHVLFQHLIHRGVDVHQLTVQTDNGSEFLGSVHAKRTSPFTRLVEQRYGARHTTIPVRTPRFNGVVENFHGRVEDEFYTVEPLPTEAEMLERLFGYILYYNFGRPNEGLTMHTPVETLQAKAPQISPDVAAFPPVVLDRIDLSAEELLPPISGGGDNRPDAHNFGVLPVLR